MLEHSRQTTDSNLYPGQNFETLGIYLHRPFDLNPRYAPSAKAGIVTQCSLSTTCPRKIENIDYPTYLKKTESLENETVCPSQILFLRGLTSPAWLSAIGAAHRIDPEFWQRHLNFQSTFGRLDYFPLPSLPSTCCNIVRLRYNTIGQWDRRRVLTNQGEIDALRAESIKSMGRYLHQLSLRMEADNGIGESIVRDLSVFDETHFGIEQSISICVVRAAKGWRGK